MKIYIAFGEQICQYIDEQDWEAVKYLYDKGTIVCKEFNTTEEAEAYMEGVSDCLGWGDYYFINNDILKKLSKYINLQTL